uniref:Uncharacterized protein n=1 Tax=Spongospora subterranea TaxID=70186 RepID=A0A0H5RQ19_9EUKA|eukprot:CRZ10789.1 hypothetical protein [Spongospora subterranea]
MGDNLVMVLVWAIAHLFCGVYWTVSHLCMIYLTWNSSSYAMPLGALYGMFAWNIFQLVYARSWLTLIFSVVWACCELVLIFFTNRNLLRPDNPDFPSTAPCVKRCLIPISAIYFLLFVAFFLFAIPQLGEVILALAGAGLNVYLSGAFSLMLLSRGSCREQSQHVVFWKFGFNIITFLSLRFHQLRYLSIFVIVITFLLDLTYMWTLHRCYSKSTQSFELLSAPESPVNTNEQANSGGTSSD